MAKCNTIWHSSTLNHTKRFQSGDNPFSAPHGLWWVTVQWAPLPNDPPCIYHCLASLIWKSFLIPCLLQFVKMHGNQNRLNFTSKSKRRSLLRSGVCVCNEIRWRWNIPLKCLWQFSCTLSMGQEQKYPLKKFRQTASAGHWWSPEQGSLTTVEWRDNNL